MSLASRAAALFPVLLFCLCAHAGLMIIEHPGSVSLAWSLAVLYLVPLAAYRLHEALAPLKPGVSFLDGEKYSTWWGGHAIQSVYVAFPFLEAALRLVPGAYSAWLRLWGSKIGRGVYWTPRVEVHDRALLDVGDGVVFGHKIELYGHTVKATKGARLLLYVRKVTIGAGAFIGAGSRMAPGVVVEDGAAVPILTDLFPNKKFSAERAAA